MTDLSDLTWRRSSYCANSSCVEVANLGNQVAVRDSKDHEQRYLFFTTTEWNAFLDGARSGEFDG
jgi:Domain of unknown function (DUF397)